jgi:hypothetical protein
VGSDVDFLPFHVNISPSDIDHFGQEFLETLPAEISWLLFGHSGRRELPERIFCQKVPTNRYTESRPGYPQLNVYSNW